MKVAYVCPTGDLYGANQCLLDALDAATTGSIDPFWVLPAPGPLGDELSRRGMPFQVMPELAVARRRMMGPRGAARLALNYVVSGRSLGELIRTRAIDLVHSNSSVVLTGAAAAHRAGVPNVWHVHEILSSHRFPWLVLRRYMLARSSRIVCVSRAAAEQFSDLAAEPQLTVVHNGVNLSRITGVEPPGVSRERFGIPADAIVIGYVGYLNPRKGVDVLVESYAKVALSSGRQTRLLLVGDPYPGYEGFASALRERAECLGVGSRTIFTGFIKRVGDLLGALDIFAFPAREPEGFPLAVLEAIAAGVATVATRCGGTAEMIDDRISGILVDPNSVDQFASALARLVEDQALRDELGHRGAAMVRTHFPVAETARNLARVYAEALEEVGLRG